MSNKDFVGKVNGSTLSEEDKKFLLSENPFQKDGGRFSALLLQIEKEGQKKALDVVRSRRKTVLAEMASLTGGTPWYYVGGRFGGIYQLLVDSSSDFWRPQIDAVCNPLRKEAAALLDFKTGGVAEHAPQALKEAWAKMSPLLEELRHLHQELSKLQDKEIKEADKASDKKEAPKPGAWMEVHRSPQGVLALHHLLWERAGAEPNWGRVMEVAGEGGIKSLPTKIRGADKGERLFSLIFGESARNLIEGFVPSYGTATKVAVTTEEKLAARAAKVKAQEEERRNLLRAQGLDVGRGSMFAPPPPPQYQAGGGYAPPPPQAAQPNQPAAQAAPAFNALVAAGHLLEVGMTPSLQDVMSWTSMEDVMAWVEENASSIQEGLKAMRKLG